MASPPHVVMFPLPLQGPVKSMLKLAELLCLSGLRVTFVVTDDIHGRLTRRNSDLQTRFGSYPSFRFRAVPDGLPESHPRGDRFWDLFDSVKKTARVPFTEMVRAGDFSCVIADGLLGFTADVAAEAGLPVFYVRTISASCLWIFFCLPKLIQAGELPFKGGNLETMVESVPGMEAYLRRGDLPGFCRSDSLDDPSLNLFKTEREGNSRAHGLILNTFEELEGPLLSELRTACPNLYTIGPLHAHLKVKLAAKAVPPPSIWNSLWQEDRACLTWLDGQPLKSVIYVSFGSITMIADDQLMEFWHGLVSSGQRFLWVIRPNSIVGNDWESRLPTELLEGMKERGYIVGWAPQEEVLAHPAVGGFLTHNGWNSTLESICEGVPMISWPYFLDQQVNSRLVDQVWKLGLDMKDTCDRGMIEKMVRELMDERKEEFQHNAMQMARSAKACLSKGGSSQAHFERLIDDIKSMSASLPYHKC